MRYTTYILAVVLLLASCTKKERFMLIDTAKSRFKVGQVWSYRTREGEEDSRVIVVKVEEDSKGQVIVHLYVRGVAVKNRLAPNGVTDSIIHLPMSEKAMSESVVKLESTTKNLPGWEKGYWTWLSEYTKGEGGVFSITVAKAVSAIEEAINSCDEWR
jgi:hypothetical protein